MKNYKIRIFNGEYVQGDYYRQFENRLEAMAWAEDRINHVCDEHGRCQITEISEKEFLDATQ